MTASVIISFEEAAFGCKKVLSLKDPTTGAVQSLEVHIPAGIETGKSIRLRGRECLEPTAERREICSFR